MLIYLIASRSPPGRNVKCRRAVGWRDDKVKMAVGWWDDKSISWCEYTTIRPQHAIRSGPKRAQDDPKQAQDDRKRGQRRPKTTLRGTQEAQKSDPESQDEKRTEPRRSQDRLGPPTSRLAQLSGASGAPFRRPKRHQNRSQNDQNSMWKFKSQKKRSKTILGPSWGDLGPSWVPSWADLDLKIVLSPRAGLVFWKIMISNK